MSASFVISGGDNQPVAELHGAVDLRDRLHRFLLGAISEQNGSNQNWKWVFPDPSFILQTGCIWLLMHSLFLSTGPGMIEKLNVKRLNSSKFLVSWDPPPVHGGAINYYELSIQLVDGSNNSMNQKHNTTGEFCFQISRCPFWNNI